MRSSVVAAGGQEDHRHPLGRAAGEAAVHLEAVEVGEHDVEQHQVGAEGGRGGEGLAAGRRRGRLEALVAQGGAQELGDAVLVVHHEDPRPSPSRAASPLMPPPSVPSSPMGRRVGDLPVSRL